MAVTGLPKMGGKFASFGPALGNYHVEVADAQIGESKTSKRPQFVIDLIVKNDPNNPGKEGKKLTKLFQSLPMEGDDEEKVLKMRGMIKRFLYDGFGIKWPEKEAAMDPRDWVGKAAWVQIGDTKDAQGQLRAGVTHIAQTAEALPIPKKAALSATGPAKAAAGGKAATGARR